MIATYRAVFCGAGAKKLEGKTQGSLESAVGTPLAPRLTSGCDPPRSAGTL